MYKVDKNFTWDKYFRQVGIYQGRCWWHDLRDWLKKKLRRVGSNE